MDGRPQRAPAIAVLGGLCGDGQKPELHSAVSAVVSEAAQVGYEILKAGGSSVDAVEASLCFMEDWFLEGEADGNDAAVTAGQGWEIDAAVMVGETLQAGVLAAVPCVRRPVPAARRLLADTDHVMLAGGGAAAFCGRAGRRPPAAVGRAGAAALDAAGGSAAAGLAVRRPNGTASEVALLGCGLYADDQGGAAVVLGDTEHVTRACAAKTVVDDMASGASPQEACAGLSAAESGAQLCAAAVSSSGQLALALGPAAGWSSARYPAAWPSDVTGQSDLHKSQSRGRRHHLVTSQNGPTAATTY